MKSRKWPLKVLIPTVLAAVALLCFIVVSLINSSRYRKAAAAAVGSGIEYLRTLEASDPTAVQKAVAARRQAMARGELEEALQKIESGETDLWSCFDSVVLLGDSRADDFQYDGFLPKSRVLADLGAACTEASKYLDDVEALAPESIVFTYGMNDVDGIWNNASDFISAYTKVINEFRERIPDAEYYVTTIISVNDYAREHDSNYLNIPAFNEGIRTMCAEQNLVLIECEYLMEGHEDLFDSDGQHFFSDLYPIWGKKIIRSIYEHKIEQTSNNSSATESTL